MPKKRKWVSILIGLFLVIFAIAGCAEIAQREAGLSTPSITPSSTVADVTPDSGVLAAEATPSPSPTAVQVQATPTNKIATPSPTSVSVDQPPFLLSMTNSSKHPLNSINGTQLLMAVYSGGEAALYCYEKGKDGVWKLAFSPVTAYMGHNGVTANKKEGDGKTPTGLFTLGFAFGNAAKPNTSMSYRKVTDQSYWVDDPSSKFYNTWVEGVSKKDWNSAEHLCEMKTAYEYAVVIEYNMGPIVAGKGSAIFLHCGSKSTVGCVAVAKSALLNILYWLKPSAKPQILVVSKK